MIDRRTCRFRGRTPKIGLCTPQGEHKNRPPVRHETHAYLSIRIDGLDRLSKRGGTCQPPLSSGSGLCLSLPVGTLLAPWAFVFRRCMDTFGRCPYLDLRLQYSAHLPPFAWEAELDGVHSYPCFRLVTRASLSGEHRGSGRYGESMPPVEQPIGSVLMRSQAVMPDLHDVTRQRLTALSSLDAPHIRFTVILPTLVVAR
jgi:hypothetical protein